MQLVLIGSHARRLRLLERILRSLGTTVGTTRFAEAQNSLETAAFEIAVIDVARGDTDLPALLERLRKTRATTGILMITSPEMSAQRVEAVEQGADDDLIRPFSAEEICARARAIARRRIVAPGPVILAGEVELDTRGLTVKRARKNVPLTVRGYRLLEYFVRRGSQLVTREDIEAQIYDPGRVLKSNAIDSAVCSQRRN